MADKGREVRLSSSGTQASDKMTASTGTRRPQTPSPTGSRRGSDDDMETSPAKRIKIRGGKVVPVGDSGNLVFDSDALAFATNAAFANTPTARATPAATAATATPMTPPITLVLGASTSSSPVAANNSHPPAGSQASTAGNSGFLSLDMLTTDLLQPLLPISYTIPSSLVASSYYSFIDPSTAVRDGSQVSSNLHDAFTTVAMEPKSFFSKMQESRIFPITNKPAWGLPPIMSVEGKLSPGSDAPMSNTVAMTTIIRNTITTATQGQSCTEFHLFSKLPAELQDQIWHYAATDGEERIIELRHDKLHGFYSNTLAQALLHTCYAARKVAQKYYEPLVIEGHFTGAHINWALDTLFFGPYEDHSKHFPLSRQQNRGIFDHIMRKCTKLAVGVETLHGTHFGPRAAYGRDRQDPKSLWGFGDFQNLRALTVVWQAVGNVRCEFGQLHFVDGHRVGDDFDGPSRNRLPHVPAAIERAHFTVEGVLADMEKKNPKLTTQIMNVYRDDRAGLFVEEKAALMEETEKKMVEWRIDLEQQKVRENYERDVQRARRLKEDQELAKHLQRQIDRRELN
ncbi:hypothetical protein PVAG01_05407 [Phlyctema vagabunda]|uniref:2EXR domain-containing protein n=1 Tax=Phlyctema vagabunda TaxID=108571 RepID=A0ABR4PK02_9HELO